MPENRILRERVAGQSAMSDVVRAQASAAPRGPGKRILGFSPLTAAGRQRYRSALGELLVGDVLENLGQRWDVLHDLPLGASVLDHLVIGPAGVFTVRTANFGAEEVIIDGQSLVVSGELHGDIQRAAADAEEAAQILSAAAGEPVRVRPLLVIVDPKRLSVRVAASIVRVVASWDLARTLTRAPRTLAGDDVARISDIADLVTTWPSLDPVTLDTQQLYRDFSRIRDDVREAVARRVLWGVAIVAVTYAVVWGLVGSFVTAALG
jgi:hypothetical protein